jgi:hypothetical protein
MNGDDQRPSGLSDYRPSPLITGENAFAFRG